jgi:hypothetical protein
VVSQTIEKTTTYYELILGKKTKKKIFLGKGN